MNPWKAGDATDVCTVDGGWDLSINQVTSLGEGSVDDPGRRHDTTLNRQSALVRVGCRRRVPKTIGRVARVGIERRDDHVCWAVDPAESR